MICTSDIIANLVLSFYAWALCCRGERRLGSRHFTGTLHLLLAILAYEIQNLESLAFISFSSPTFRCGGSHISNSCEEE